MALRARKGLVMTILMLVLFMLMLAELMTFVLLNIGYNNIEQQISMSASSINYGNLLRLSASSFAQSSLSAAIRTLTYYEYNASLRKDNFITNASTYVAFLIKSGSLPNVPAGSPTANTIARYMGNLTFESYNASISNFIGGAKLIQINETTPVLFQTSPYTLSISYAENIAINASGSIYRYSMPVNATIPLNGTYDLFYAQQGILREIKFSPLGNLTSVIGGSYATIAGTGSTYGTVINVPSGVTCTGLTSNVPTRFQSAPFNSFVIIATANAVGITNGTCKAANNYGGLITYQINNTNAPPTVPYLVYQSTTGVLGYLHNGSKVLLYGPGMATLDINNLRNAISNGYYFASPFTPSYIDRASANFMKQSQNGLFTFSNYNRLASQLNGQSSYISSSTANLPLGSSVSSAFAWVYITAYPTSSVAEIEDYGVATTGEGRGFYITTTGNLCFTGWADDYCSGFTVPLDKWSFVGYVYTGGTNTIVYMNGLGNSGSVSTVLNTQAGLNLIGKRLDNAAPYISGEISNVQIYNTSLSPSQVAQLYQEGISALPISNAGLVGWWPLDGNANDYSGFGNNGVPNSVQYLPLQNYSRDSIFNIQLPTKVSPIPGILSCDNPSQCSSSSPKLYLGSMPLAMSNSQNNLFQTANFNGNQNSYINVGNSRLLNITKSLTITAWVNAHSNASADIYEQSSCNAQYELFIEGGYVKMRVSPISGGFVDTGGDAPLPTNQWVFVAGTFNITNAGIYTNGNFKGSVTVGNTLVSHPGGYGYIGELVGGCTSYDLNGNLSNVQLYNTSLSGNQIKMLYKEGISGIPLPNAGLVGWWPLDGNANDYSGLGNNGTTYSVTYPYFSGAYPAQGPPIITGTANEWQVLGLSSMH
jgi:hypothetical protein